MTIKIYEMNSFYYIVEEVQDCDETVGIGEWFIPKSNYPVFKFYTNIILARTDIEKIIIHYKEGLHTLATLFDKVFDPEKNNHQEYLNIYSHLANIFKVDLREDDLYI